MLENRDLIERIEKFGLEPYKVGEEITVGSQHLVMRYGYEKVIKLPRNSLRTHITGRFNASAVRHHIDLIDKYFTQFYVDTEVLSTTDGNDYLIIQDYLSDGEYFGKSNFHLVKDQFSELLKINKNLMKNEGKSLDFFGFHGLMMTTSSFLTGKAKNYLMSNLFLDSPHSNPRLLIMDTNLSELKRDHDDGYMRVVLDSLMNKVSYNYIGKLTI
ncbi:MAG: hypothetical protein QY318_02235 [Candidatus Dojkabacteria bacterium]|nr:MAG: hypothetical protein QY318_02235 [Candidatus Dojkabacteria bacterium]